MSRFRFFRSAVAVFSAFVVLFLMAGAIPANAANPTSVATATSHPGRALATNTAREVQPSVTTSGAFSDVPGGAPFFTEISWLSGQGISTGWAQPDGSRIYGPLLPVNRDAMAAFMYRLAGSPDYTAPATSPFTDVPPGAQFYKEITWLADKGISTGWPGPNGIKTYRPLNSVNRDAMAAFMYRFAGSPTNIPQGTSFADVGADNQFYNQIAWLASQGISTGWAEPNGSKTYRPLNAVNRDAMAAFMYRFYRVTHPLTISGGTLHDGIAGARYLDQISAIGGIAPLTWTAIGLPIGVTLTSDGAVTGVPATTGSNSVNFTVTDAAGSTATASRALNVPTSMPAGCINQACAALTPTSRTVQVPASLIAGVTRDAATQKIAAVTIAAPAVNGTTISTGQVLVLAPTSQMESGAIVYVDSLASNPDGTVTATVTPTTPADAYLEGTVNSIDPTVPTVISPMATPPTVTPATASPFSCDKPVTAVTRGLSTTANMTPALAAIWKHPLFGFGGIYVGTGGLDLFQFDLDGEVKVVLGASISGQAKCTLTLPEMKAYAPAGELGAVVFAARPTVTIEVSGATEVQGSVTLKCGAEYRWNAGNSSRVAYCKPSYEPLAFTNATQAEAKITGAMDVRVALDDTVGITGQINASIDAKYTPTTHPIATLDGTVGYELGACLACFWSDSPLNVTLFTGTFFQKRIATFDTPLPPPSGATPVSISTSSLPDGSVGTAYRATAAVAGGTGPYSWSIGSGALPAGLIFNTATGTITGVPTQSASSALTLVVHDSSGGSASRTMTLTIIPPSDQNALVNVQQIVGGYGNAYALKKDGTVTAWGGNGSGQLGDGTTSNRPFPVPVLGLTGAIQIASTGSDTYALKTDGSVWAWGNNNYGQIGDGTFQPKLTPVKVTGLPAVKAVYAGSNSAYALGTDGRLWAWGSNAFGELGDGTTTNHAQPVVIPISNVKAIAAGAYMNAYALKTDGTVWAWGTNYAGQLGNGTALGGSFNANPAPVQGLNNVNSIAAGSAGAYAVKQDGTVWSWGENSGGRLGDGTTTNRALPVQVAGLTQAVSVTAGSYGDVFSIRSDGSVWGWGDNSFGEMFDPFISPGPNYPSSGGQRLTPAAIPALAGISQINAGGYGSSYLVKADGSAWSWGHNDFGQLGDGTTLDRHTLIPVGVQN